MKNAKKLIAIVLTLVLVCGAVGCKKKKMSDEEYLKLAETKAEQNKKKVLLRMSVDDGSVYEITAYDAVYYLAYNEKDALDYKAQQDSYFISVYGSGYDFWSITDTNGTTVRDGYKDSAYATLEYVYTFYLEAKKQGMQLDESRRLSITAATEKFLASYSAEQRARCGMTEACIRENYEKIFLAEQFVDKMTTDYEVDEDAIRATVNKEDYRVYKTNYLYVSKYERDEDYRRIELSEEEAAKRKAAVEDALERVKKGESMESICTLYEEFMYGGTSTFTKQTVNDDPDYNNAAMALKKGECTLFERDSSYNIIVLTDNTDFSGYEEAVDDAIVTAKSTGVADLYQTIDNRYELVKTEEWDAIKLGTYTIGN